MEPQPLTPDVTVLAEQVKSLGYAVVPGLLNRGFVESVRPGFLDLLETQCRLSGFNRGTNRCQMYLPFEPPFAVPELYANPLVLAVLDQLIPPEPALVYFASDTALPGCDYQFPHSDTRLLFPETGLSLPTYGVVLNVPLVDCSVANGSLEFWPGGSHLIAAAPPGDIGDRIPGQRANLKAGDGLLRDLRMWHRGTPNRSTEVRPHLALVYVRGWYRFEQDPPVVSRPEFDRIPEQFRRLLRYAVIR